MTTSAIKVIEAIKAAGILPESVVEQLGWGMFGLAVGGASCWLLASAFAVPAFWPFAIGGAAIAVASMTVNKNQQDAKTNAAVEAVIGLDSFPSNFEEMSSQQQVAWVKQHAKAIVAAINAHLS